MEEELISSLVDLLDCKREFAQNMIATLTVLSGATLLDGVNGIRKVKSSKDEAVAYCKNPKEYPLVLIAAYNEEAGIGGTIKSFLDQGYPSENIFVADDGSTDRTRKIACKLVPSANVISKKNRGKVAATHQAILEMKKMGFNSDYLILTDADLIYKGGTIDLDYLRENEITSGAFYVTPIPRKGGTLESRVITVLQDFEYRKSMRIGRQFDSRNGGVLCASGAGGIFQIKRLLSQMKDHSGIFTGDDLERTLIDLSNGGKVVFLISERIFTYAPSTFGGKEGLFNQRYKKWWPGFWRNFPRMAYIIIDRFPREFKDIKTLHQQLKIPRLLSWEMISGILEPFKVAFIANLAIEERYGLLLSLYFFYTALESLYYVNVYRNSDYATSIFISALAPLYGLLQSVLRMIAAGVLVNEKLFKSEWKNASTHMLSEEEYEQLIKKDV